MNCSLKHKSSILVAGPSMSGKTVFVENLIKWRQEMFDVSPRKIHWFSGSNYETKDKDISIYEGVPENFDMIEPHDMVVIDDLMFEAKRSNAVSNLFTRMVHHTPCTVIFITQNLFQDGKETRTRSLNTQYIVLFKNPRDASQITTLSRQMYPGKSNFLINAYKDATDKKPFGYLFLDLHQETTPNLRVRSRILPFEEPHIVYLMKV